MVRPLGLNAHKLYGRNILSKESSTDFLFRKMECASP